MSRHTGHASLPLHGGKASAWLRRLSDPFWFQAFGGVLAFFAAGGKGGTSRRAPSKIGGSCGALGRDPAPLVYASFEELLGIEGVGPRTLRALAPASELMNGTPAATRDPARFALAHGGKDGIPFPVDRLTYDRTIEIFHKAVGRSAVDRSEKVQAFKRLAAFGGTVAEHGETA